MNITFLGIGQMGSRMAAHLLANHSVTIWNRDASKTRDLETKGAQVAPTPRAAAEGADVVISMVRGDRASRAVWLDEATGAAQSCTEGTLALECSTTTLAWSRELGDALTDQGITFVDAPLAGTLPQAEAAQLVFFCGGDETAVDRARPVLAEMGQAVHHCGAIGSGAAVKLMVNALFATQLAAVAELLGMIGRAGVSAERALEVVGSTAVCSPAAKGAGAAMLAGKFAPLFPIDLVEKDLGYVVDTASANSAHAPVSSAVRAVFAAAKAAGHADENITAIARLYSV